LRWSGSRWLKVDLHSFSHLDSHFSLDFLLNQVWFHNGWLFHNFLPHIFDFPLFFHLAIFPFLVGIFMFPFSFHLVILPFFPHLSLSFLSMLIKPLIVSLISSWMLHIPMVVLMTSSIKASFFLELSYIFFSMLVFFFYFQFFFFLVFFLILMFIEISLFFLLLLSILFLLLNFNVLLLLVLIWAVFRWGLGWAWWRAFFLISQLSLVFNICQFYLFVYFFSNFISIFRI